MTRLNLDEKANPCERCGAPIGHGWKTCDKRKPREFQRFPADQECFDVFCAPCAEQHELEVHVGPREREVLRQWQEQAR